METFRDKAEDLLWEGLVKKRKPAEEGTGRRWQYNPRPLPDPDSPSRNI